MYFTSHLAHLISKPLPAPFLITGGEKSQYSDLSLPSFMKIKTFVYRADLRKKIVKAYLHTSVARTTYNTKSKSLNDTSIIDKIFKFRIY